MLSVDMGPAVITDGLACEGCGNGKTISGSQITLRLGRMLTPRLGLLLESQYGNAPLATKVGDLGYIEGTKRFVASGLYLGAQDHVAPRTYVRASLGLGRGSYVYEDTYKSVVDTVGLGASLH